MRNLSFVLAVAAALLASCSDSEPSERTQETSESADPRIPAANPTATSVPAPPPTPDADAGSSVPYCDAIAAWCPFDQWTAWPLGQHEADWLGIPQQCYCECWTDADCGDSPNPSQCGVVFDVVQGDAGPEKKPRFNHMTVCRYSEFQQAN